MADLSAAVACAGGTRQRPDSPNTISSCPLGAKIKASKTLKHENTVARKTETTGGETLSSKQDLIHFSYDLHDA